MILDAKFILEKGFFAYSKGFIWFKCIPHSPHFLCEQNEIDWLADDHKCCTSLRKVFLHGKHYICSHLAFWEACVPSLHYTSPQSLLEYKAMNVERQHRIFVEPRSDSIHIALCRNYGFLHSFHNFSKSKHSVKIW